jgi:isoquinoline 1-oxidoreductase beta subunit
MLSTNGKAYPYGQFADSAAASLPAPDMDDLVLKVQTSSLTLIGKPVTHRDTHDRITGQANFGIDVQVPNMLNATSRSTHQYLAAKPVKWDEQAALC